MKGSMIKTRKETVIDVQDWDELVTKTYGRVYSLQQQGGCQSRGRVRLTVPTDEEGEDFKNDTVPEKVNHPKMGVSFKAWLARDPKQKLRNKDDQEDWSLSMWWERNFYPSLYMVADDLYAKGLIKAGEYSINIDW
jgi:hypothetical protein